jgi:hypothetical protein
MINLDDIKQMLEEADDNTLTLYLNVDNAAEENQATQPAWKIWLKDALRGQAEQQGKHGAWQTIHKRVEAFLSDYHPNSKSLALFTGENFQRQFELQVSLPNQVHYGKPAIMPLLWALDEFEPYFIALVDQEKARFVVTQLGQVTFSDTIEIDLEEYEWQRSNTLHSSGPGAEHTAIHGGAGRDDFQKTVKPSANKSTVSTVTSCARFNGKRTNTTHSASFWAGSRTRRTRSGIL